MEKIMYILLNYPKYMFNLKILHKEVLSNSLIQHRTQQKTQQVKRCFDIHQTFIRFIRLKMDIKITSCVTRNDGVAQ